MNNLAEAPDFAKIRGRLHRRLIDELTSTGDPRVSENVVFEQPPYTDVFRKRKSSLIRCHWHSFVARIRDEGSLS